MCVWYWEQWQLKIVDAKMFIRIGANLMNIYESIDELYN